MRSNTPYEYLNREGVLEEVYSPSNPPPQKYLHSVYVGTEPIESDIVGNYALFDIVTDSATPLTVRTFVQACANLPSRFKANGEYQSNSINYAIVSAEYVSNSAGTRVLCSVATYDSSSAGGAFEIYIDDTDLYIVDNVTAL